MSDVDIEEIRLLTKKGLSELLEQAHLEPDDLFVLGLSTSEVQGKMIGKHSNIEIGRTIVKTIIETLKPLGVHLAVQGCEHLNRALVVEKAVAKAKGLEIVSVFPRSMPVAPVRLPPLKTLLIPLRSNMSLPMLAWISAIRLLVCMLSLSRCQFVLQLRRLVRPT